MAHFNKGGDGPAPFGKNVYLRSTDPKPQKESYTFAAESLPFEVIDGTPQRVLQSGEVLAKITSGPNTGKVGVFQAAGTSEVQTATKGGTWSAGTYRITAASVTTGPIAFDATAADINTALGLVGLAGLMVATGGPLSTTAVVFTFGAPGDQSPIVIDVTGVTGTSPTVSVAETTKGVAGAGDGRDDTANIVGINDTFLPWQLLNRDVEVAATYDCYAVQAWCFERNAAGARIPLTNTTADAMRGKRGLDVKFK